MELSDLIGPAAALIVGIANWIHTNRRFNALHVPVLRIVPHVHYVQSGERLFTWFDVSLCNLGPDVTAQDIKVSVKIRRTRRLGRFRAKYLPVPSEAREFTMVEVGERKQQRIRFQILEEFLIRELPKVMIREETPQPRYRLLSMDPLDLLIKGSYRPVLYGSRKYSFTRRFSLVPQLKCYPATWQHGAPTPDLAELVGKPWDVVRK